MKYTELVGATATDVDYLVFSSFTVADEAVVSDYSTAKINITAYAIQADGFANAEAAWAAYDE